MQPATRAVQRPQDAKLLVLDESRDLTHAPRSAFIEFLSPGDLVVANDAATLPASLHGRHEPTGESIEVRLAGRASLRRDDLRFTAIVFGGGDYHTRTEDRPLPPRLSAGDRLVLGTLVATIEAVLDHPRLISLVFAGNPQEIWAGLAATGRPIQYAHLAEALELWDAWTPFAGVPAAFEPPSAGFALDWSQLRRMHARGIQFATITHAAGISSTGDERLDARLPLPEPYRIAPSVAASIRKTHRVGRRVVAIGTTVVRALEHSAVGRGLVFGGEGVADQRIGPRTKLKIVDAILSGTHEPGTSHYELLRAFASDATLRATSLELDRAGYRTHEFGDSVFVVRSRGDEGDTGDKSDVGKRKIRVPV